jgi:hypothetical protein
MIDPSDQNDLNNLGPIQVSIVKEIAEDPEPSLGKLHAAFVEELGHGPDIDLIDYFTSITVIRKSELKKYLDCTGLQKPKNNTTDLGSVGSVIYDSSPTVLQFLQNFQTEYGTPPSEYLTNLYLERAVKITSCVETREKNKQNMEDFAKKIADTPRPTVLIFRKQFIKEFDFAPADEITEIFLDRMQSKNKEGEVYFARIGAHDSISTVLEFRNAFTKTYGKAPPEDLIKIFITNRKPGKRPTA